MWTCTFGRVLPKAMRHVEARATFKKVAGCQMYRHLIQPGSMLACMDSLGIRSALERSPKAKNYTKSARP